MKFKTDSNVCMFFSTTTAEFLGTIFRKLNFRLTNFILFLSCQTLRHFLWQTEVWRKELLKKWWLCCSVFGFWDRVSQYCLPGWWTSYLNIKNANDRYYIQVHHSTSKDFVFCCCFFETMSHYEVLIGLELFLDRPGWSLTYRNLSASASWVMGLKIHVTTPSIFKMILQVRIQMYFTVAWSYDFF